MKSVAIQFTNHDAKIAALSAAGIDIDEVIEAEDDNNMVEAEVTTAQKKALLADDGVTYLSEL